MCASIQLGIYIDFLELALAITLMALDVRARPAISFFAARKHQCGLRLDLFPAFFEPDWQLDFKVLLLHYNRYEVALEA
jgi:hypothetical protein